jgi:phage baseplate assembly protein W
VAQIFFDFTLPPLPAPNQTISNSDLSSRESEAWGRDIWFGRPGVGIAQRQLSGSGDWLEVSGHDALRQSVIRRLVTNPGEWATLPDYGVGARAFVKDRNTRSRREELTNRIREQLLQDARIAAVEQVLVESGDSVLIVTIKITPKARFSPNPVGITVEIQ